MSIGICNEEEWIEAGRSSLERIARKNEAIDYGKWLLKNCLIIKEGFNYKGPISNEEAYELYLGSLKNV